MKVALFLSLAVSTAAFSQQSRRQAFAKIAGAAAFVPVAAANAAAGESPRFSIFGVIGEGDAMSEGAAYGSDQSTPLYSAYSVYGDGTDAVYDPNTASYEARDKAILAETKKRVAKLDGYIAKKQWSNVTGELTRYMYETRSSVKDLAKSPAQKEAAKAFISAMESTNDNARLKRQDAAAAGAAATVSALDAFVATL